MTVSAKSSTFMDSCSFEQPNICGMIHRTDTKAKWERVKSVDGGANTDFTNMGQCNGTNIITLHYSILTFIALELYSTDHDHPLITLISSRIRAN